MDRFTIALGTNGNGHIIDLTEPLRAYADRLDGAGLLHLFLGGSTASLATIEFEPGLVKHDLPALFQRLAAEGAHYAHEQTWHDDNGHAHLLAALFRPEITIPFIDGSLLTGQWQQLVLIDFDTRPRRRQIICSIVR